MKDIKVFHGLYNYGTQAGLFAEELRKQGIVAYSVCMQDKYKRRIDYMIKSESTLILKKIRALQMWYLKIKWFFSFNIFHFYYGTSLLPDHRDLPFYKFFNKTIVFHYLGKDVERYQESIEKYSITNMAYSCGPKEIAIARDEKIKQRLAVETKYADLQIVCNPIYSEFVPNSVLLPLAINIDDYPYSELCVHDPLRIMHAPTSRANKGTSFIIAAIERLIEEGYMIDFNLCEGLSHKELKEEYIKCDLCIDQVLGGYGTVAIEAMAIGRPVISYLRDIHFNESTFPGGIPIIVANRDDIYDVLKQTIEAKDRLQKIGLQSRKFVEKHHDVRVLTRRLVGLYKAL